MNINDLKQTHDIIKKLVKAQAGFCRCSLHFLDALEIAMNYFKTKHGNAFFETIVGAVGENVIGIKWKKGDDVCFFPQERWFLKVAEMWEHRILSQPDKYTISHIEDKRETRWYWADGSDCVEIIFLEKSGTAEHGHVVEYVFDKISGEYKNSVLALDDSFFDSLMDGIDNEPSGETNSHTTHNKTNQKWDGWGSFADYYWGRPRTKI